MAVSRPVLLFGIVSLSFMCFVYIKNYNKDFKGTLLLLGRGAFLLCFAGWLVSVLYPRLRYYSSSSPAPSARPEDRGTKEKQDVRRRAQQEEHSEKASAYQESVLKPREEERLRKREERFYRMVGEEWKLTEGYKLGDGEASGEHEECEETGDTPNVTAMRRRKLPENVTQAPTNLQLPKEKKVVVLPDEPPETAEGVVRVILRCPGGRTIRRRFLESHSSLVLQDWMLRSGYPPDIYTVCTSYPRQPLHTGPDLSLAAAGVGIDTVLNVEEKDSYAT